MKKVFLTLFILFLIGYNFRPVLAQREEDEAQNPYFKAFIGLYRGFLGFSRGIYAFVSNIWDFKLKSYLGKIVGGLQNKDLKNQILPIETEFKKEAKELKTEIPGTIRVVLKELSSFIQSLGLEVPQKGE